MSENKDQRNSQRAKTFNQSGERTIEEQRIRWENQGTQKVKDIQSGREHKRVKDIQSIGNWGTQRVKDIQSNGWENDRKKHIQTIRGKNNRGEKNNWKQRVKTFKFNKGMKANGNTIARGTLNLIRWEKTCSLAFDSVVLQPLGRYPSFCFVIWCACSTHSVATMFQIWR